MTKIRPKKVRTKKMTGKSVIPDDQKIDTTGFFTFDQLFPKKG